MEHVIEKIKLMKPDAASETMPVLDSGVLVVHAERLEFRGKKGTLEMSPVRDIMVDANVTVEFGEGGGMRSATFADFRRGKFKTRSQNRLLADELRERLEMRPMSEVEAEARKQQKSFEAEARVKRATRRMWIGGGAVVVGAIATAVSYGAIDDSSGGTYYVFWGAVLFGVITFIQGIAEYRKYRHEAGRVEKIPSGKGTDVQSLKAARDIDGLIEALWVNELEVRVAAMDALAELNDGTVAARLIPKLSDLRWDVRWSAAEALGKLGDPRAIEPLKGMLNDPNALVRGVAEDSLKALKVAEA